MVSLPNFLKKKEDENPPLPLMPTKEEVMKGSKPQKPKSTPSRDRPEGMDLPAPDMPMPVQESGGEERRVKPAKPDLFVKISEYRKAKDSVKELRHSVKEMLDSLTELEKIKEHERAKLLEADNTLRSAEKVVGELDEIFQTPVEQ